MPIGRLTAKQLSHMDIDFASRVNMKPEDDQILQLKVRPHKPTGTLGIAEDDIIMSMLQESRRSGMSSEDDSTNLY